MVAKRKKAAPKKKPSRKQAAKKKRAARKTRAKAKAVRKKAAKKKVAVKKTSKKTPKKKVAKKKMAKKKAAKKKATPKKAITKKAAAKKTAKRKITKKQTRSKAVRKTKPSTSKARSTKTARSRKTSVSKTKPTTQKKKTVAPRKSAVSAAKPATATKTESPATTRTKVASGAKMLPRDFLIDLATAIRTAVLPAISGVKGREVVGSATSGDATFQLDKLAEKALFSFLRSAKQPVAYYSEDAGYTTFTSGQPQNLLIVDPIDGTRAAKSGFEGCVVSVATTRVIERPHIGDTDNACILELMGPRTFYAERGKGARMYVEGQYKKPKLSQNTDLEMVSWSMTVPARPAELIFPTAAKLIDLTSLKGGFFACNSTSFSLTRLLTNQLDACVDFANRYLRDIGNVVEDQFINAGRGAVLGIAPYDLAAALLIAQEAGCTVTDAYGESLDNVLLLDSSVANHRSLIAAANEELHGALLSFFDTRIRQFEQLLERRMGVNS